MMGVVPHGATLQLCALWVRTQTVHPTSSTHVRTLNTLFCI